MEPGSSFPTAFCLLLSTEACAWGQWGLAQDAGARVEQKAGAVLPHGWGCCEARGMQVGVQTGSAPLNCPCALGLCLPQLAGDVREMKGQQEGKASSRVTEATIMRLPGAAAARIGLPRECDPVPGGSDAGSAFP